MEGYCKYCGERQFMGHEKTCPLYSPEKTIDRLTAQLAEANSKIVGLEEQYSELYQHHVEEKHTGELCETKVLREQLSTSQQEVERLRARDGNATITLGYETEDYPYNFEKLQIVDFGVSDNQYVVEIPNIITKTKKQAAREIMVILERNGVDGSIGCTRAAAEEINLTFGLEG